MLRSNENDEGRWIRDRVCGEAATVWMPRDAIKIHLVETLTIERRCLVFPVRVVRRSRKFHVTRRYCDLATYQRIRWLDRIDVPFPSIRGSWFTPP